MIVNCYKLIKKIFKSKVIIICSIINYILFGHLLKLIFSDLKVIIYIEKIKV